ncbi:hypothetical protein Tco_0859540 [Tanacetum coccineum]|uniref:Uncharacterized protein n=1 Tax=Tanacetum coccineum TaxID=301880 RepID=A0ABQ5BG76_9ASTR
MAQLKYCDKHNQVGFLFKPAESAGYTEIVDFLRRSKLRYALTHNPPIYDSLVKQLWQTATAKTLADGTQQLNATIDSIEYTITEESVRRQLQLANASGINMLQNEEIFAGLQNIGSKSGGWDQFGSNIATALICLSTGRLLAGNYIVPQGYPLTKEVLSQLLDLKLETEEESTMALELIKFVKQQLEEFEDSNDDDLAKSDHEEAERV